MNQSIRLGLHHHRQQVSHLLLQVFFVGLTLGLTRTVMPGIAQSEFGIASDAFVLIAAFVVTFGVVKGVMNFLAGRWADRYGRKPILITGWLVALPIPFLLYWAPSWAWVVTATVLLGANQGLAWSMTQTSKLDLTDASERGLAMGLNEFAGYVGMAIAGLLTAYFAEQFGAQVTILVAGVAFIGLALALAVLSLNETQAPSAQQAYQLSSTWQVFKWVSWHDKRLFALNQAGLVEKFVDALVWVFYPLYLVNQGLSLVQAGWVVGTYGVVWGASQFVTGKLSDVVGRKLPIIAGMWLTGLGVLLMLWVDGYGAWLAVSVLTGIGMALLYPNLGAAVADLASPSWRGSAIGIYRFWRDTGYAVGALSFALLAQWLSSLAAAFWFVGIAMLVSGGLVWWLQQPPTTSAPD